MTERVTESLTGIGRAVLAMPHPPVAPLRLDHGGLATAVIRGLTTSAAGDFHVTLAGIVPDLTPEQLQRIRAGRAHLVGDAEALRVESDPGEPRVGDIVRIAGPVLWPTRRPTVGNAGKLIMIDRVGVPKSFCYYVEHEDGAQWCQSVEVISRAEGVE